MTTTIILNSTPYTFGVLTNKIVAGLLDVQTQLTRLSEAVDTAADGYTGTPGVEYEVQYTTPATSVRMPPSDKTTLLQAVPIPFSQSNPQTLFGVQPSATPGEQGLVYQDAINQLNTAWATFWSIAQPYLKQLDNGTT
jgi:hypothetical protein